MDSDSIVIGQREYAVWPAGQEVRSVGHRTIGLTTFADTPALHPALVSRVRELESDVRFAARLSRASGGVRVYHLDRWESGEADLLNARAMHMAQMLLGSEMAVIDRCWASVSRRGDYTLPHSNERTAVTIVYCVDPGDDDPMDPLGGKLAIVDPRVEVCCPVRKDCVTNPLMPRMVAGTMFAFPSALVHCVNSYSGERPFITLNWTIDRDVIPGSPLPTCGSGRYNMSFR